MFVTTPNKAHGYRNAVRLWLRLKTDKNTQKPKRIFCVFEMTSQEQGPSCLSRDEFRFEFFFFSFFFYTYIFVLAIACRTFIVG